MDLVEDLEDGLSLIPYLILGENDQTDNWIMNEMIGYPTSYVINVDQMKIELKHLGYSGVEVLNAI